jgi:uncharacterized phage infection (PIP) family protein YhgE
MKRIPWIASWMLLLPLAAIHAQDPTPAVNDIEARRQSVIDLENHITQREERLAEWGQDVISLNTRIDKRVDGLVTLLTGLRDSQESKTNVTQIKKEAIEGLQRGITLYTTKRREIREMVRTGSDEALGDLSKIDANIIKRIDQIAELTKSIPTHKDVEKYENDDSYYSDGYYYESRRISDEYKQNRRDGNASDLQRKHTSEALKKGIERLKDRRRALATKLKEGQVTDSEKALYQTELGQADAYQDHLEAQLRDVTTGGTPGGGRAIGRDQANDIENMIEDARKDLREDVSRLFRSYDQFVRGRHYLAELKENLAARKEWLKKNDPAGK